MAENELLSALRLLKAGKLVALPTETVYGLAADARNPEALRQIFLAKERPFSHPLIVHLASMEQVGAWAAEVPEAAYRLAQAFWPGPLTLVFKKQSDVPDIITANQDTVALRIPSHPLALALLEAFGDGLAAPSANRYTQISPTTAEAVREELGDKVDLILDGGPCRVGIESTILDLSRGVPTILRPGMISAGVIETVLGQSVSLSREAAPRVPGMDLLHYAPRTPLRLVESGDLVGLVQNLKGPAALLGLEMLSLSHPKLKLLRMSQEPQAYAKEIYFTLRQLDKEGFHQILVERPPQNSEWSAILDRLEKAAIKIPS